MNGSLNSCFQSVSNGKALIAAAITDNGIPTAADAVFHQMANNIRNLSKNITLQNTDITENLVMNYTYGFTLNVSDFRNTKVRIRTDTGAVNASILLDWITVNTASPGATWVEYNYSIVNNSTLTIRYTPTQGGRHFWYIIDLS